jgi:hypothetical protein
LRDGAITIEEALQQGRVPRRRDAGHPRTRFV